MSAAALVLPLVWAAGPVRVAPATRAEVSMQPVPPEMAFYRKYTEGILRRYVRMSLEAGRVPSLLGKEMFRAKVTSYRVESFEDVVIFLHDVESCLGRLDKEQQSLISRVAMQQYTVIETAELLGMKPKTVVRRYRQAIDRLTRVFLNVQMLQPSKACQGGGAD